MNGGTTSNNPFIGTYGLHFTANTYVDITGNFVAAANCTWFSMWINIIKGAGGNIANIGISVRISK